MCCESKGESGENASTFRFDEQTWYVDESGAEMCFTIEAPDSWSLRIDYESEDRNWMSVTPEKGAEGVTEVTFKVERADRSNGERIARVVAVCGDAVRMKKIVQKKNACTGVVVFSTEFVARVQKCTRCIRSFGRSDRGTEARFRNIL